MAKKDPFKSVGVKSAITVLESHGWQITTKWTSDNLYAIYFRRTPRRAKTLKHDPEARLCRQNDADRVRRGLPG